MRQENWDLIVESGQKYKNVSFADLWKSRDLLFMFVKRDLITVYKQTLMGPIWFFIQPALSTIVYFVIFSRMAKMSTDGLPPILFYLCGVTCWSYFSDTVNLTSKTFIDNASIFGKVYFPRIILPLSKVISGLLKFGIQFSLFLIIYLYYLLSGAELAANWTLLLLPVYILILALISLGCGMLISSLTTRYRDLIFLVTFGLQLMMFATPVIYPISMLEPDYQYYMLFNPFVSLLEGTRYAFTGVGMFNLYALSYSLGFAVVLFFFSLRSFSKVERSFMDTI